MKERAAECGWTPKQTLEEITVKQLLTIWYSNANTKRPMTPDRRREIINSNRMKRGLPPMKESVK